MKKYILFLILILVVVSNFFIANTVMVNNNANKKFAKSGYVLKYTNDAERYYFGEEATYKESYNDQVVFKDVENDKVVVDKNNFIHYSDGSISSFKKGALINLDEIETDPITYYNFSANKVLKKLSNNKYIAKNLDKELEFTNLIWKITDKKYLLVGSPLKIIFDDENVKEIDGYLEIEYTDNEVVKIYNQELKYETISTEVYLQVGDDIKINLGNKIISKNDIKEMSLGNMVIDSNDNVNMIDLEEYNKEDTEDDKEENDKNNSSTPGGNNSGAVSGGDVNANGGSVNIGGTVTPPTDGEVEEPDDGEIGDEDIGGDIETEVENSVSIISPKYKVTEFKVTATGVKAIVEIEDEEARLTTGTFTSIINNATGKIVYSLPETGETTIKIDTASLEPGTEYTLVMEASYAIDEIEYSKNFIYKVFRTSIFGITLEKDLFTDESLSFNVNFDNDSTVSKLDVELVETGDVREGLVNTSGNTEKVKFTGLTPDTQYTVKIKNVFVENTSNANTYSYTFKTLKTLPKLANGKTHTEVQTEIDKRNSQFILSILDLEKNVVETLNYKIFKVSEGQETLVYNRITTDTSITLKIDEIIQRNIDYYCRVYATFYDNEKFIEYEIANTESSFKMNSSQMPSVRFEKGADGDITFNTIKGNIIIDDIGNTINLKTTKVEVTYTSTTQNVDDRGTLTYSSVAEGMQLPINLTRLKANETYKLSVYATYDLHDGNGEQYGHIGSVMITTKEIVPMIANWNHEKGEGIDIQLQLASSENSDREAETLYSFDLSLYLGQTGASKVPYKKTTVVDSGVGGFEGNLKFLYYDNAGDITKNTFGLTDAQVAAIESENEYCTIVIDNVKDYVSSDSTKKFENIIPVVNFSKTYEIKDISVRNPAVSTDAILVSGVKKSDLKSVAESCEEIVEGNTTVNDIVSEGKINNNTITAIRLQANLSNILLDKYKYFEYFIYDDENNLVMKKEVEKSASGEAPKTLFLLSNGTGNDITKDEGYLARGNTYYLAYYAYDEQRTTSYPTDPDYWKNNQMKSIVINKQEPNIIMYPSKSNESSITYKYKISDIDNAIEKDLTNNNRVLYNYYAGGLVNKSDISESSNDYTAVEVDLSGKTKNLKLEVKTKVSLQKNESAKEQTFLVQKFEGIINITNFVPEVRKVGTEFDGISSIVSFSSLDANLKAKITNIELEIITDTGLNKIVINKDRAYLEKNNWEVKINYLEDIILKTSNSLKGKELNIKVKIYHIDGKVGYDEAVDFVVYQTANDKWLKIDEQNFIILEGYPEVFASHNYDFETNPEKVFIKQNGDVVAWVNYSSKGFVRNINNVENVIIPKTVNVYETDCNKKIVIQNVIPGIDPEKLEITGTPNGVKVKLEEDGLIFEDTIIDGLSAGAYKIYMDIYKKSNDTLERQDIEIKLDETINVENLGTGTKYYAKFYIDIGGEEYYLYDLKEKNNSTGYAFRTIDEVTVSNLNVEFEKSSIEEGQLIITHKSDIKEGFKGFEYQILDKDNNLIENILYKTKEDYTTDIDDGKFIVDLDDYDDTKTNFQLIINANRASFFEYGEKYTVKITPIINFEGNDIYIGDTKEKVFSYDLIEPIVSLYARTVKTASTEYMQWTISSIDDKYLIVGGEATYQIFETGSETPIDSGKIPSNYAKIKLDSEKYNQFNIENTYTLKIKYVYYTQNKGTNIIEVERSKTVHGIKNGMSIGTVAWQIEEHKNIKLKFYDSYELSKVKTIKCSIYDVNGQPLNTTATISNIAIQDYTTDSLDPHKSITIDPEFTFAENTSYKIIVHFLGEGGVMLAEYEPENPETSN